MEVGVGGNAIGGGGAGWQFYAPKGVIAPEPTSGVVLLSAIIAGGHAVRLRRRC
jgi:hypothetical protein